MPTGYHVLCLLRDCGWLVAFLQDSTPLRSHLFHFTRQWQYVSYARQKANMSDFVDQIRQRFWRRDVFWARALVA